MAMSVSMNMTLPTRIGLKPINKLVGFVYKNCKIDVVVMEYGKIYRKKCYIHQLDTMWITGIVLIKYPRWHKVVLIEEMP